MGRKITSMITRLKSWLSPPVFPADEEKTRVAGLQDTILLTLVVLFGVYNILALVVPAIPTRRMLTVGPECLLALALCFAMCRGHVRRADTARSAQGHDQRV